MSLISITFFIFLAALVSLYYILPRKCQWVVLLSGSVLFYIWAKPVYIVFIGISIVSTWYLMLKPSKLRWYLTVVINLGLLIVFRYSVYFGIHDLIVPLGISFYTFMTLGYAHDVCGKKLEPETNLFKYALFISYFPQITQGPIGTYQKMQSQLTLQREFDISNIKEGGYRIIKGMLKKLVVAGRLTYYVDTVFSNPEGFGGLTLITAVFFYTIELYADFSGYMDIACGVSKMFGIDLTENFVRPYFARTIDEFWRRWHISLNEWFKEHLMMPAVTAGWNRSASKFLGKLFPNAKKGTIRTLLPLILVWIITGIWHGAEDVYIGWGVYFAIIMTLSVCTKNSMKKLRAKLKINEKSKVYIVYSVIKTYLIVFFGEVMFEASSMVDALTIYRNIFTKTRINAAAVVQMLTPFGNGNQAAASVIIAAIVILGFFGIEFIKENNDKAFTKHRYIQAAMMLIVTILFGVAGQSSFMYQAF